MIVPDVNLLIHAYNTDSPDHSLARAWWEENLNLRRPIGLAWVALVGFIRLATNRAVLTRPLEVAAVLSVVRSWLEQPAVRILIPGERHGETLFRLLEEAGTAGNLTTDAHLAALAMEYRAEIASTDTDFARFRGLRWFNPLARPRRGPGREPGRGNYAP